MVKISILYPNTSGTRFDMDYYIHVHMPMSLKCLESHSGFRGVSVERGLGGPVPGLAPAHVVMCHFSFESTEAFLEAFLPHAEELQGDIPNYTDIEPVIQINEVLISR